MLMLSLSGFKCKFEFCYFCLASYKLIQTEGNARHDPSCKHHTNNINYGNYPIPEEDSDDDSDDDSDEDSDQDSDEDSNNSDESGEGPEAPGYYDDSDDE